MRLRTKTKTLLLSATFLAAPFVSANARAADIVDGRLVFAKDALATYSFESVADLTKASAGTLNWVNEQGYDEIETTPFAETDVTEMLVDDALDGKKGLRVRHTLTTFGLALRDDALFSANAANRISVSMWGKAMGAEPVLQLVFTNRKDLGTELVEVFAIRTGRETDDGWVEYSTGPVDATALGVTHGLPLRAILLTARYPTKEGLNALVDYDVNPGSLAQNPLDLPTGYAVIDAVEVRKEAGAAREPNACTVATIDTDCDADQDCMFGHCIDGALVWGPVPLSKEHRTAIETRWNFIANSLQSDRQSIARAPVAFQDSAKLADETSPRGYFAKLNEVVVNLRDSHTELGWAPSNYNALFPPAYTWSGPMEVCFGLADNDVDGSGNTYVVFDTGSPATLTESFQKGDVVTAIDGIDPDRWISLVTSRIGYAPPDPASEPSHNAIHLGELVGRYASTLNLSRCTTDSGCTALPDVDVGDQLFANVVQNEWPGGYSKGCGLRFHPSVESPPADGDSPNQVVVQTVDGITSVEFNGFEGATTQNYAPWKTPMSQAFAGDANVIVDARVGWGGYFDLGKWLFHELRASDQAYGMFTVPRGTVRDPDPSWLISSAFDACPDNPTTFAPNCAWMGYNTSFTSSGTAAGEGAKIAWLNGNDLSMNDIVPRLMQGRANFRVFGPHPTQGSYGEVSEVPPILPAWGTGSIQVLDMRFGSSPDDARAQRWESGHGVVPDEVVVQKLSDILNDQDTTLNAAKAWLLQ